MTIDPRRLGAVLAAPEADAALRAYLAWPIILLLGTDDVDGKHLVHGGAADAQGANRHARGLNAFHAAQAEAERRGWAFGWRLVEVPGVGHDAGRMFASPGAVGAVQGTR